MKKLVYFCFLLFLVSCQKRSEIAPISELRLQIGNSVKEAKESLNEFIRLKKAGAINSNYKSTSDQLFEFLESKHSGKESSIVFDKPVSIINRNGINNSEATFSSTQTSNYIDFNQFQYVPRAAIGSNLESFILEYEEELDNIAQVSNIDNLSTSQLTDSLNEIANGIKEEIAETSSLANTEKEMLLGVFDGIQALTPSIIEYFQSDGATNNFSFNELETFSRQCGFFCKLGRAVLRVAVAVVTVAAVAVVPVSAIAIAKKASFILSYKTFMLKGYSIGTVMGIPAKLKAGLLGGLYFGVKSAEKGWDKDWKGWPYEFTLGLYVKSEV